MYGLPQGELLLPLLSEEGNVGGCDYPEACVGFFCVRSVMISLFFLFCFLQDWKEHQHICCQTSGGVVVHEDEPITAMDMDKVK